MSDLFLSHSSKDNDTAMDLRNKLRARGYRAIFLDVHHGNGIESGIDWERELYRKLRQCEAVIVLCSEVSMASNWCFAEIIQARALEKPVFPVKISPCEVVDILRSIQVTDISADPEEGLDRLCDGLRNQGLDPEGSFDRKANRAPFPGLRPFEPEDAWVYFGREPETAALRDVLSRMRRPEQKRLAVALGASGCGKSSLVRAGLIPKLSRSRDDWILLPPFRPGTRPITTLAVILSRAFADFGESRWWRSIRNELRSDAAEPDGGANVLTDLAVDLRLAGSRPEATVLLVIDQLEEILGEVSDGLRRFIVLLRRIVDTPDSGVLIVATLRSDFLAAFQLLDELQGLEFENFLINPLPIERFAEVIEGPSMRIGLKEPEAGLVDVLVRDAQTKDALPLLAFTLEKLYEMCRSGDRLTLEAYEKIGGIQGVVENVARDALGDDELNSASGRIRALRRAFLRLVSIEENDRLVRREALWNELPVAAESAIEKLITARLLVSRGGGEERIVEVAHESIFRVWSWLSSWLDNCTDFLQRRRRLRLAMAESERLPDDPSVLLQGQRLAQGVRWLGDFGDTLTDTERAFVERSRLAAEEQERERARFERQKRSAYFNHITLAQRFLDENQIELAEDNLESCDPDFRHWEWHHLARQCGEELGGVSAKGSLAAKAVDAAGMGSNLDY
jgi:hypothetical protein